MPLRETGAALASVHRGQGISSPLADASPRRDRRGLEAGATVAPEWRPLALSGVGPADHGRRRTRCLPASHRREAPASTSTPSRPGRTSTLDAQLWLGFADDLSGLGVGPPSAVLRSEACAAGSVPGSDGDLLVGEEHPVLDIPSLGNRAQR